MIEIREMEIEDMETCARLFVAVASAPPWSEPWTPADARRRLEELRGTPASLCLIAIDGEPVGYLLGHRLHECPRGEFEIDEMGVHPDHQRRGVGRMLMEHLEAALADSDVEKIFLLTRRGIPAEAFYETCGFRRSERTIVMSKVI